MMTPYDSFVRYYDADVRNYTEDLSLYHEMAQRTGGPLLELMCGTGRILLPLAEAGYQVTGVDISSAMLDVARRKAASKGLSKNVTLIEGDVRSVALPANHFALVFVAINSFMHLEEVDDQLSALATIRHTLDPDGILVLDIFNPNPSHLASEDNRLVLERSYTLEGRQVYKFVASESDMADQISHMTWMYDELDEHGQVHRQVVRFHMRWLYRYELEHLLARAGFLVESVYGSHQLDTYTAESERLIVFASRRNVPGR